MLGRTNTGGGGGGLNFKVICNPQPSTAKENTIWIDTDRINNYYFSATQPENMADYDVWIRTGTSSTVAFSATKKKPIMVYPIYATQYVGGSLVNVTAKSWQGGEWVEWVTYLLNGTNLCEDITGGWTRDSVNIAGQTNSGTVNFSENGIALSCGSGNVAVVRTKNKIDFSGKKKLAATMKATTIGTNNISIRLYIIDGLGNVDDHDVATIVNVASTDFVEYTIEDISNLDGAYYVALVVNAGRAGACKNIFLE